MLSLGKHPTWRRGYWGLPQLTRWQCSATKKLAGSFNFVALGEHRFKGIDEPTAVWQVEGERVVSWLEARQAALTEFVNRDKEIDLLLERWRQSKSGEGQVVVLSGEPGIGKSRLAQKLVTASWQWSVMRAHLPRMCSFPVFALSFEHPPLPGYSAA